MPRALHPPTIHLSNPVSIVTGSYQWSKFRRFLQTSTRALIFDATHYRFRLNSTWCKLFEVYDIMCMRATRRLQTTRNENQRETLVVFEVFLM